LYFVKREIVLKRLYFLQAARFSTNSFRTCLGKFLDRLRFWPVLTIQKFGGSRTPHDNIPPYKVHNNYKKVFTEQYTKDKQINIPY